MIVETATSHFWSANVVGVAFTKGRVFVLLINQFIMPRPISTVWEHFLVLCETDGKKHVTCSYCSGQYKHAMANKLKQHLLKCKKCPNDVKNLYKQNNVPTILHSSPEATVSPPTSTSLTMAPSSSTIAPSSSAMATSSSAMEPSVVTPLPLSSTSNSDASHNITFTTRPVGDASGSLTTSQQDGSDRTINLPEAKEIIASVYRYLQTEYENLKNDIDSNRDLSPLANILKRTAEATGVSKQTVTAVLGKGKRSQESTHDTVQQKRAKSSYYYEDDDVSPIDEESCEDIAEGHNEDDEGQTDQESDALETLKVEFDEEEDEDHRNAVKERMRMEMEATSCETTSAVQHLLFATHANVKTGPVNTDYQQTMPDVQQLQPSEHVEIKQEPSDIEYQQSPSAEPHVPPDVLHNPVKLEPSYGD